jgi:hypothetical protein
MVRPRRFERLTLSFGGLYSIHLSYGRICFLVHWRRVELLPVAGLAPETSAYTNSATSARLSNIPSMSQKVEYECITKSFSFEAFSEVHS